MFNICSFNTLRVSRRPLQTLAAVGLLALSGCATPPPAPPTHQELSVAATQILSKTIRLEVLARDCSTLGGATATNANRIHNRWLQQNWRWVAAADTQYSLDLAHTVTRYQGEDIAPGALKFLAEQETLAERAIGFNKRSRLSRQKICEKHLAPYADAANDYNNNAGEAGALEHLTRLHSNLNTSPHRVPRLAGSLDPRSEPGRSHYAIENQLRKGDCGDFTLYTFRNQWPDEAYGAFCSNGTTMLFTCSWGTCTQEIQ